eukprot:3735534-Amphidinium_carterae.1
MISYSTVHSRVITIFAKDRCMLLLSDRGNREFRPQDTDVAANICTARKAGGILGVIREMLRGTQTRSKSGGLAAI